MAILPHPASEDAEARRLAEARAAMARTRALAMRGRSLTAGIFETAGVGDWGDARPSVRSMAFACRLCRSAGSRDALERLIGHLEAHAGRLLHRPSLDDPLHRFLLLQQLAERHPAWRKEPGTWRPRRGTAAKQLADLLAHLLGPAEAARFTASVFCLEPPARVRLLFGHLSRGENNRPDSPRRLYLTKRMALHFLQASARGDLIRALRWGQIHGLGGSARLAQAIDLTRLAWQLWEPVDEEWWVGVLHWFANHPELDVAHVTPIVEFVRSQRYGDPEVEQPPAPAFSMKGRTPAALLRLVEEWHAEVDGRRHCPYTELGPSGIRPGRWQIEAESGTEVWTIEEILDSSSLREEGHRMHHCVGRYLSLVKKGPCSIWSMRKRRGDLVRRATTIQLNHASRRIVQCRGPCDRQPKPEEKAILKLWAQENGLSVSH
jgi:hypothetical protein